MKSEISAVKLTFSVSVRVVNFQSGRGKSMIQDFKHSSMLFFHLTHVTQIP